MIDVGTAVNGSGTAHHQRTTGSTATPAAGHNSRRVAAATEREETLPIHGVIPAVTDSTTSATTSDTTSPAKWQQDVRHDTRRDTRGDWQHDDRSDTRDVISTEAGSTTTTITSALSGEWGDYDSAYPLRLERSQRLAHLRVPLSAIARGAQPPETAPSQPTCTVSLLLINYSSRPT